MSDVDPFVLDRLEEEVTRARDRIASDLEQMAARIRDLPLRASLKQAPMRDYFGFVEDVLHHLRAGNGNLVAERLVRAAQDAHDYSRGIG